MIDLADYTRLKKPNPQGRVLVGSSAENYYTWVRGSAATINGWAEYATEEWNWANTKDYFNKSATYYDDHNLNSAELAKFSNQDGPLHISHSNLIPEMKPFCDTLESTWVSKGGDLTTDVYSRTQKGLFNCINTIYKGTRSNISVFIKGKDNITLVSSTTLKVLNFDGTKAVSVTVISPDGQEYTFLAKNKVIVAQRVYESAQLLMLSGTRRKADLEAHSINVLIDSKHVSQNLLDHPILSHVFKMKDRYSLDSQLIRGSPQKDNTIVAYKKNKTGVYSSGLLKLVAFPRADEWFNISKKYR